MQQTKRIAAGAAAVLTALMLMLPASAHGGHHHKNTAQPAVTSCGYSIASAHTPAALSPQMPPPKQGLPT